jgi:NAD(P)-dependent dehydrogenase (short-subunit alcohol dehydrogenase family)
MSGNARFTGAVVIVAGGTGALGRAVSEAFLREGAIVVTTYRSKDEQQRLIEAVPDVHSRLEGAEVDVTDETATRALVQTVMTRHSRLDILVNTVGGYAGGTKLWDVETTVLDRMLALNLRSFHALVRAVVPVLLKQRRGAIVNVAAKAALDHPAGASAYAASKAAALAMTDSLAAELLGSGVRANTVLPSVIDTPANRLAMPKADFAKWPTPTDIARVILFLCSDEARAVHGASIPVYGNR